jgi:hypothetical protein
MNDFHALGPREIFELAVQVSAFSRRRSGFRFVASVSKASRTDAGRFVCFRPGFVPAAAVVGELMEFWKPRDALEGSSTTRRPSEAVREREGLVALKQCRVGRIFRNCIGIVVRIPWRIGATLVQIAFARDVER